MFPEVVLVCQESAPCMEMSYKLHGQASRSTVHTHPRVRTEINTQSVSKLLLSLIF
jgi:hypothetical protein